MNVHQFPCFVALAAILVVPVANAAVGSATLTLDPAGASTNRLTVTVGSGPFTDSDTSELTGSVDVDLDIDTTLGQAVRITFTGGSVSGSDVNLSVPFIGGIAVTGVEGFPSTPAPPAPVSDPATGAFDATLHVFTADRGVATGSVLGTPVDLDFSDSPATGAGVGIGMLVLTPTGSTSTTEEYDITISLPVDVTQTDPDSGGTVTMAGTIQASGSISIPVPSAPLLNLSTRGNIGTGDYVLIGGIIIGGPGTKKVLITGRGQSISSSVPGRIADPKIRVIDSSGAVVASSDNWSSEPDAADILSIGIGVPGDASDAAVLVDLAAGAYTAIVDGVGGATGIGIVELFDVEASSAAKILNLSTRGHVGTGDGVLIGGVVVGGSAPERLEAVFRGRGPSLPASVPGRISDPVLRLTTVTGSPIADVDDWAAGASAGDLAGGYSTYQPLSPFEPALVERLFSGAYTAILEGSGGGTGIGIIEVFVTN